MNIETTVPLNSVRSRCANVSWGAILAGLSTALALQILFMLLGAGLGFAIYHPITEDNPVSDLATGAVVVHGISAVFSLWFGGWVAGRFARRGVRRAGWLHGLLVWTTATVAGVLLVGAGAGWALGDLSKLVGGGLAAAGKPAAAAVSGTTDLAKQALKQSNDTVASYVDEALGSATGDTAAGGRGVRAKREIGLAATRFFLGTDEAVRADNRTALVNALAENTGVSPADADRMVNEWTASYDRVKADLKAAKEKAEVKAREAADKAAKTLAIFSLVAFAAFALGGISASLGGCQGAKHALDFDGTTADPVL